MAVIYYVKDGPRPGNSGPEYEAPLSDIEARLVGKQIKYLGVQPPEINVANPSQYPNHVVIEIKENEPFGLMLSKPGFFLIEDSSPSEIETLVFPNGHPQPRP